MSDITIDAMVFERHVKEGSIRFEGTFMIIDLTKVTVVRLHQTVVLSTDAPEPRNPFLDMTIGDFFTEQRLSDTANEMNIVRAMNGIRNTCYNEMGNSLEYFLMNYNSTQLRRTPNFGKGALTVIQNALEAVGLTLEGYKRAIKS